MSANRYSFQTRCLYLINVQLVLKLKLKIQSPDKQQFSSTKGEMIFHDRRPATLKSIISSRRAKKSQSTCSWKNPQKWINQEESNKKCLSVAGIINSRKKKSKYKLNPTN